MRGIVKLTNARESISNVSTVADTAITVFTSHNVRTGGTHMTDIYTHSTLIYVCVKYLSKHTPYNIHV